MYAVFRTQSIDIEYRYRCRYLLIISISTKVSTILFRLVSVSNIGDTFNQYRRQPCHYATRIDCRASILIAERCAGCDMICWTTVFNLVSEAAYDVFTLTNTLYSNFDSPDFDCLTQSIVLFYNWAPKTWVDIYSRRISVHILSTSNRAVKLPDMLFVYSF